MRCLMIHTNDRRKFFTHEENFPQLIEFSKTFKAEISLVQVEDVKILRLEELAPALCDANYRQKPQYKLLEVKLPKNISNAAKIRNYVKNKFLNKNPVSLKEIKKKFKKYNLTDSCLCNHIRKVKKELAEEGYKIYKVGPGAYKIE